MASLNQKTRLPEVPEVNESALIQIVTGGINAGKSSKLFSIYREVGQGDGFINLKVFEGGSYVGQKIMRLSTGESECFSFKEGFIPSDWDEAYRYDAYSFSRRGLTFANKTITDIIVRGTEPVFIDEIGPLELEKKGFFHAFKGLLAAQKKIYVVVRCSCVERVVNEFGLGKYQIIKS